MKNEEIRDIRVIRGPRLETMGASAKSLIVMPGNQNIASTSTVTTPA
jgi:hypothetical protein